MLLAHGSNLLQKENHPTKYRDEESREFLKEIRVQYDKWFGANRLLNGPTRVEEARDFEIVARRVALFEDYKDFLDQRKYAEKFDSWANLHSTVLEEFMYYLFRDLVRQFGAHALIGKSHAFKDIFFVPNSYSDMIDRPHARIEKKDHDFIIGTTVQASFQSSSPVIPQDMDSGLSADITDLESTSDEVVSLDQDEEVPGTTATIEVEKPIDYAREAVTRDAETHLFDIPAVAIECKTYLDKTMLEGASRAAQELKARNPNGLYIVVMEWIKLTDAINLRKYAVDQIYVLRKQKNTDREFRYEDTYTKNKIDPDVIWHLYTLVRNHLTVDWQGGINYGIKRGYLL